MLAILLITLTAEGVIGFMAWMDHAERAHQRHIAGLRRVRAGGKY